MNGVEPYCPKCKEVCTPRKLSKSLVYDCKGCGDQISSDAILLH